MANISAPPGTQCGNFIVHYIDPTSEAIATAVLNCILNCPTALSAIVFNSLIMCAIWRENGLRSHANYLLAWLAMTDVLVGVVVQPLNIAIHAEVLIGKQNCIVHGVYDSVKFLCSLMSVVTALFISCDRCVAITFPFNYYSWMSATKTSITLILAWMFWIIVVASWTQGLAGRYVQLVCVSFLILTFVILSTIYAKMIKLAKQHQHQIDTHQPSDQQTGTDAVRHKKALKTAVFIIGALMVCYLPIVVVVLVDLVVGNKIDAVTRSREIRAAVFKILNVCEKGRQITRTFTRTTSPTTRSPQVTRPRPNRIDNYDDDISGARQNNIDINDDVDGLQLKTENNHTT
ncbi:Trace amine-associated receptor 7f [Exaiptasia diaphana]|nr:Trace amine-associated receptor 7f [Exaiptasia diaphana]